ncbi:hypothetical protein SBV1_1510040 [Verrucomicrobia bacterium]|nr:hypothetical protein SBV1_1510040 [Verrucomicrobiota bacterium]
MPRCAGLNHKPDTIRLACSGLGEFFRAEIVQTFAGSKSFGNQAAVQGWFNAHDEFAAEFFPCQRFGQFPAVSVNQVNHFLDGLAQLSIHLRLVAAVNAAEHDFRATSDEALILVAPFHEFRVMRGLRFDLFACHNSISFTVCNARRTSRS